MINGVDVRIDSSFKKGAIFMGLSVIFFALVLLGFSLVSGCEMRKEVQEIRVIPKCVNGVEYLVFSGASSVGYFGVSVSYGEMGEIKSCR